MSETLPERDLRPLMTIVEDGRRDHPTEGMPWAVLDGLAKLVPCDRVNFPEADLIHNRGLLDQWVEGGRHGMDIDNGDTPDAWWEAVKQFLPCTYPQRTGDYATVVRWSDFYTSTDLRCTPLYAEFHGADGSKHGLHAAFPTSPGHFRKISFWRDTGSDFTERDRLVVQLLRPHLYEIYLDAQRCRRNAPQLTRREWEVLRLADQGMSNGDIANQLFISIATVRKHLEHIFDRTGVRTRIAASAMMMPYRSHILPPFNPDINAGP